MSRTSKNINHRGYVSLRVEKLELRSMMAVDFDAICRHSDLETHDHVDEFPAIVDSSGTANATTAGELSEAPSVVKSSLTSLPQLSSLPSAKAKLVLDFNGNTLASWGMKTNVVTPAYDIDGDPKTFSAQELANIKEIWARVAEDYAPFNIDVTTIDPGQLTNGVVAKIVIGGSSTDWYGASVGGVAYIGGFYNNAPNVGFAFAKNLGNGNARYTADAVSHEAGHLFGLSHQAEWSGSKLVSEYSDGNATWAPIMGVGYYAATTTWSNGATSASSTSYQDDMSILAGSLNGFGYRANLQSSASSAVSLGTTGTVSVNGLIAKNTDQQWWKFTTGGGTVSLNVNTATVGANLDSVLEIRNSAGTLLYSANASNTLNSSLKVSLGAGTYYAVVRSTGVYGYVGQYTLTGSFPKAQSTAQPPSNPPPPTTPQGQPKMTVSQGTTTVADGGSVSFGTVNLGGYVDKTFTVKNSGTGTLTLQALKDLPLGFTVVSKFSSSTLQAGQSTTFTVRMIMNWSSRFAGEIDILSNDASNTSYRINVSGLISSPEISMTVADGGTASFGTTTVGKPVDITFTIRSYGTAPLFLQAINPATLPAGFSIVSNIVPQTLGSGKTTTFTIRMNATKIGTFSGTIHFITNDYDEGVYDINLAGNVTAKALAPAAASVVENYALIDELMSQFAKEQDDWA
jgi:hypothetical protein